MNEFVDPYPLLPQPQPSRSRWFPANAPVQVRLEWSGWPVEIQEVRLRNVNTQADIRVRPTGRLVADVRRAFAQVLAQEIVAAAWPAPVTGMRSPASSAELLNIAEESLDPRLLAAEVVRVIVQIAAVHAGIPLPVARVMGQAAGNLFTELSSPDSDAGKVQAVQYVDLALSAEDGSLINSPALPQIVTAETANVIDKLLDPDERPLPPDPIDPSPSSKPAAPWGMRARLAKLDQTGAPRPAPPGWYTVPGTTTERWWDGARWTAYYMPPPSPELEPGGEGRSPIGF
jgi:hypothetical protein